MENPVRAPRHPMRVEITHEQRRLKKDQTGDPHRRRSAKHRQQLLGCNRLNKKQQKRGKKNCTAEKNSQPGHAQPQCVLARVAGPAPILLRLDQIERPCQMVAAAGRISSTSTHCVG